MVKSFTAQIRDLAKLTKQNMRYVATESIQDVLEAAQTPQLGITKGATSFVEGKIPVAEADLINSLVSGLNGSVGAPSATSYTVAIGSMQLGDMARFAWTAEHAMRMEHGFTGTDALGRSYNQAGRHFVGANAAKFEEFVKARVREVKK